MALTIAHKEVLFGVGDMVKVSMKVKEGEKTRTQVFEGMVIGIKGHGTGRSFTVRKIGVGKIGIEMIFPINTPSIEKIEVVKKGTEGVQHAKLYYTRHKSAREIEKIYSRVAGKNKPQKAAKKKTEKKVVKKTVKKTASKKKASKNG